MSSSRCPSGRHVVASPELVRGQALAPESPAGLAPWQVPALAIAPGAAVDLLLAPPEAFRPGASPRYLAEVAKLACELAAAGRVLPVLVEEGGHPAARWRPLPAPTDAGQLALLPARCPPAEAERTASGSAAEGPEMEGCPPQVVLRGARGADRCGRPGGAGGSLPPPEQPGRRPARLPGTTAWLGALTAATPVVDAGADELAELARAPEEWRRSGLPAAGGVRTCFRLVPPTRRRSPPERAPSDVVWRLELLLQGADDPSLLVPAAEVARVAVLPWPAAGSSIRRSACWPTWAGQPGCTRSWSGRSPSAGRSRSTSTPRARTASCGKPPSLLAQAGFGVLTPSWWRSGLRPPQADRPTRAAGGLGHGSWRDGAREPGRTTGGNSPLATTPCRPRSCASSPGSSCRWCGSAADGWSWIRRSWTARSAFLSGRPSSRPDGTGEMSAAELLQTALGLEATGAGLTVVAVDAQGWVRDLLAAADRRLESMATPPGFHGRLRPYQERGLAWLLPRPPRLGACLADDMGLGRAPPPLRCWRPSVAGGARPGPTLLVCPGVGGRQLAVEAERFTPGLAVHVHHGAERLTGPAFRETAEQADLVVTTYALAARDRAAEVPWARIVLDEAQNVKNSAARRSQAVRSLRAPEGGADGHPEGEPAGRAVVDQEFLNPGLLGSARAFRARFAGPGRALPRRGRGHAAQASHRPVRAAPGGRPTARSSPTCQPSWR